MPGEEDDDDQFDDESTTGGSVSPEFLAQEGYANADYQGWKLKWKFPIDAMTVKGWRRSVVVVQIRLGDAKKQIRELIFDSVADAEDFRRELEHQKACGEMREEMRLHAQLGDQQLIGDEKISFLVEIVSGWNLPAGDLSSSDPFVKCSFNGKLVHQTGFIHKT